MSYRWVLSADRISRFMQGGVHLGTFSVHGTLRPSTVHVGLQLCYYDKLLNIQSDQLLPQLLICKDVLEITQISTQPHINSHGIPVPRHSRHCLQMKCMTSGTFSFCRNNDQPRKLGKAWNLSGTIELSLGSRSIGLDSSSIAHS